MLPTRPLRAVLTVMLMAFATVTSRVQHALLRSKHWLVDGPALRTASTVAVRASVAALALGAMGLLHLSRWQWG